MIMTSMTSPGEYYFQQVNNIQLMTFDEVNTRIDQPMEHVIHLGILCSMG